MARVTHVSVLDDLDGRPIDDGDANAVPFSFRGVDYVIDLRTSNVMKFEKALEKWIEHANRVGGRKRSTRIAASALGRREQLKQIREWARGEGYDVSDRGKVPEDVIEAFEAANA
ncbi:nucloid associated Lsr2-like [Gordonia phage OneUp]|uniref:Lsr2 n=1 Tax=Gordonia phage OneUp TaxID=1838074 RepID=A0A160DEV0_9CAUD|nr:nucloid associated Lsr2-like [Gordonia phage OneUp]ANA86389.1 Lsr2 [Gordonia phage OneUp]